jgi:hypothetical protein
MNTRLIIRILLIAVLGIVAFWLIFWTLAVLSAAGKTSQPAPTPTPSCITETVIGNSDPSYAPGYVTPGTVRTFCPYGN